MFAETILYNAKVATNGVPSFAEAVAITDAKITAVGTNNEILRLRGPQTRVIDARRAIAFYLFVEAILEFVIWFHLRDTFGAGWLLVDGIVTVVLSVMIWSTWPSSAAWVVGTLVGVSMLFSGLTRFILSLTVRRLVP